MTKVHPSAVVNKDVELGDRVEVGPNCVVEAGVRIGSDTILDANVVVCKNVRIGCGNHLFPNCTIGCNPQMLGMGRNAPVGRLIIGDRNVIREQVTIHPGMKEGQMTQIGSDNLLMVGVHIGHDCTLADKIVLSNYGQISGHCHIGQGVWFSGIVASHQFVTIGKWSYASGLSGINRDVPPFLIVSGHYPPLIRGVNKRGLSRAGLDEQQQQKIHWAYEVLYRREGALLENARKLAQEDGVDENVQAIIDAIVNSSKHRYGRYLETFRQ